MTDDPQKPHPMPDTFEANRESDELDVRELHGSVVREKEDLREGNESVPLWMIPLFMVVMFWGGAYLAFYSGGFQSTVFDPARGGGGTAQAEAKPDPKVVGKRLFTANCVACHQATGLGVAGQFPPLVGSEWVLGGDWHGDNHLISILLHGLQGPIQVKGNSYNGAMPPWKQLKDDQIASILTYIRGEWGNSAPPITAEQVAKIREETASQAEPYTQAQLQAMPAVKFEAAAPAEGSAPPASGAAPVPPPATPGA